MPLILVVWLALSPAFAAGEKKSVPITAVAPVQAVSIQAPLVRLDALLNAPSLTLPAGSLDAAVKLKLEVIRSRAAELASAAPAAASASAQPSAVVGAKAASADKKQDQAAAATARESLDAAKLALEGVSPEQLRSMPVEELRTFAASIFGERRGGEEILPAAAADEDSVHGSGLAPYAAAAGSAQAADTVPPVSSSKRRLAEKLSPAVGLVSGLALIELAVDARGTVLPTLIDGTYGHASALALAAVAHNLSGIAGRQAGAVILSKLGLRRGFAGTLAARAALFAAMAAGLAAGAFPLTALLALLALDGFLYGAANTAEAVAPAHLVGREQAALERLSMWQQLLLPIVAVTIPVVVGASVSSFGFMPVLVAVPILFAAAAAWLALTLRTPHDAVSASEEGSGVLRSLRNGFSTVVGDPVLRLAYVAYIAFNLLNPLMYAMIAPVYALRLSASPEAATSVFGWLAGLFSLGWLGAGVYMAFEQRALRLRPGDEAARLRKSMTSAMTWAAAMIPLLAVFAFSPQTVGQIYALPPSLSWLSSLTLPALALIPLGLAQVLAAAKARSFFQSRLPASAMTDGMAFLGASSLAAVTLAILGLKWLFASFGGMTPFALFAAGLPLISGVFLLIARRLSRLAP